MPVSCSTKNGSLSTSLVTVKVEKVRHEAREVESTKGVTDAKFELSNAKKTLSGFDSWASADRSGFPMLSRSATACKCGGDDVRGASSWKGALTARFDHLKWHSTNM